MKRILKAITDSPISEFTDSLTANPISELTDSLDAANQEVTDSLDALRVVDRRR